MQSTEIAKRPGFKQALGVKRLHGFRWLGRALSRFYYPVWVWWFSSLAWGVQPAGQDLPLPLAELLGVVTGLTVSLEVFGENGAYFGCG